LSTTLAAEARADAAARTAAGAPPGSAAHVQQLRELLATLPRSPSLIATSAAAAAAAGGHGVASTPQQGPLARWRAMAFGDGRGPGADPAAGQALLDSVVRMLRFALIGDYITLLVQTE
jgi:hypothetical protein